MGGIAEAVMKMCFGNGLGFSYSEKADMNKIFGYSYASFILEVADWDNGDEIIGTVTEKGEISYLGDTVSLDSLLKIYEDKLESVFTCNIKNTGSKPENVSYTATERIAPSIKVAKPRVLIPVFPGTNCEYDSAKAVANAGAEPIITVINNLSADGIARSIEGFAKELKNSQIIFIPGGFSGGDEPDGSVNSSPHFSAIPR